MVSCAIFSSFSALKIKHRQQPLEGILPVETGVRKPALFIVPLGQSAVVKSLLAVLDEEGNNIEPQAFFQCDQPPDSAVAVLEGMDLLKFRVKGDNNLYRDLPFGVVCVEQGLHLRGNVLRFRRLTSAHDVRAFFVIPHGKPVEGRILRVTLENEMQLFDDLNGNCTATISVPVVLRRYIRVSPLIVPLRKR